MMNMNTNCGCNNKCGNCDTGVRGVGSQNDFQCNNQGAGCCGKCGQVRCNCCDNKGKKVCEWNKHCYKGNVNEFGDLFAGMEALREALKDICGGIKLITKGCDVCRGVKFIREGLCYLEAALEDFICALNEIDFSNDCCAKKIIEQAICEIEQAIAAICEGLKCIECGNICDGTAMICGAVECIEEALEDVCRAIKKIS
jgi:hypothetical protein